MSAAYKTEYKKAVAVVIVKTLLFCNVCEHGCENNGITAQNS